MRTGEGEHSYGCCEQTQSPQALLLCDYHELIFIELHIHVLIDQFYHNRFVPRMIIGNLYLFSH